MYAFTIDENTDRLPHDPITFDVTKRDEDGMPVDQYGPYPSREKASRAASNLRYAQKTRRTVTRK